MNPEHLSTLFLSTGDFPAKSKIHALMVNTAVLLGASTNAESTKVKADSCPPELLYSVARKSFRGCKNGLNHEGE